MNSFDYLLSFQRFGIKLGLDNVAHLLQRLGNPHHAFPAIHIAGTNGKGSVAAFMHSVLVSMGYKTGRFTSPHLVDFSERILVNDVSIQMSEIEGLVDSLVPIVNEMENAPHLEHPTFFEAVTAMAFQYFADHRVDFAVVEVGMGGRYDSTNVVRPCLSVITNVSMEHTDYLGDTIEKIACEKAGIIKPDVDVVSAAEQVEVRNVIDSRAAESGADVYYLSRDFRYSARRDAFPRQWVEFESPWTTLENVEINLAGEFQAQNAAVALMGLELLRRNGLVAENEGALRMGMAKAAWPGRFEKLADSPLMILDVAHNPSAMLHLVDSVLELFPDRRIILVVGMLKDKDEIGSLRALRRLGDTIIVSQPDYERAMSVDRLARAANDIFSHVECRDSMTDALQQAVASASPHDLVLVTGSLFNVAEVRRFMSDTLDGGTGPQR